MARDELLDENKSVSGRARVNQALFGDFNILYIVEHVAHRIQNEIGGLAAGPLGQPVETDRKLRGKIQGDQRSLLFIFRHISF